MEKKGPGKRTCNENLNLVASKQTDMRKDEEGGAVWGHQRMGSPLAVSHGQLPLNQHGSLLVLQL